MNLYPDTVTLYHKLPSSDTSLVFERTILQGVNWQGKKAVTVSGKGVEMADVSTVYVPSKFDYVKIAEGDILVNGIANYELPPKRIQDLHADFDETITVMSMIKYNIGSCRIRHREVSGQ